MAEVTRQFEVRQLLKAYRKGLISDELFAEQMREIGQDGSTLPAPPAPPARTYRLGTRTFATERELVVHFLDEFRAAETFGGETFARWSATTGDPVLRGGLRVIAEREASHGRLLAGRLAELGARTEAVLPAALRDAALTRLAAREVPDLDKLGELTRRLPDIDAALGPIRDVITQLEEDAETRALLELLIDEEASTLRWLHAMEKRGAGKAPEEAPPGPHTSSPSTSPAGTPATGGTARGTAVGSRGDGSALPPSGG